MTQAKRLWTDEEVKLLYSGLTNEEIAYQLHRSLKSVEAKRWRETGHCCEVPGEKLIKENPEPWATKERKILRLKALAIRLGVKLLGRDE